MTRRVRVGVIGAGYWAAAVYLPVLARRSDVELVVISRRDGELAQKLADRFGAQHATDDWARALELGLDAVVVASPPHVHAEQVCRALSAGAHVLCEKPFAIRARAAWDMLGAARSADRSLTVAFGWNHMAFVQHARQLCIGAAFGALEWLSLGIRIPVRRLFVEGVATPDPSVPAPRDAATFTDPKVSGGGQLPGTMSHVFGMAMYVTSQVPDRIHARTWQRTDDLDIHDAVTCHLPGGGIGVLTCATTHGAPATLSWSMTAIGSRGQISLESSPGYLERTDAAGRRRAVPLTRRDWTYRPERPLEELLKVAAGGRPSGAGSAELAAWTVELVEAAYRSVQTGADEPVTMAGASVEAVQAW